MGINPLQKPVPEDRTIVPGLWEDTLDDFSASFETSAVGNTALGVFVQDQTTQSLDLLFLQDIDDTTLDGASVRDSRFFDVAAGGGALITAGNIIEIGTASIFIQARVLGIATDRIEIDSPMTSVFPDGTTVFIKTDDLKVDGSSTPQVFQISPETNQIGDITRIILKMEGSAPMDSGTFGPLPALTIGVLIRFKRANGDFTNLINFKTNGKFISKCFDHAFLPNNGNGVRLFVARLSYGGQDKFGVVQRLDGRIGDQLQAVIQDDLTGATLLDFELAGQGHEVQF